MWVRDKEWRLYCGPHELGDMPGFLDDLGTFLAELDEGDQPIEGGVMTNYPVLVLADRERAVAYAIQEGKVRAALAKKDAMEESGDG
jgi:hypothetical protein